MAEGAASVARRKSIGLPVVARLTFREVLMPTRNTLQALPEARLGAVTDAINGYARSRRVGVQLA
jgi:hypothetical protein